MERIVRKDLIQPGISISNKYSTTGTLGLIVYDKEDNYAPCILSNWHIMAKRSFIPRLTFRRGSPIYQPGKKFGGKTSANIVGRLVRHKRRVDAAIAKIVNRDYINNQFETDVIIQSARMPQVGDIVEKSGARTGVTKGRVTVVNGFLITIKPLVASNPSDEEVSDGGDSGSVWYDPVTHEGLVLHNAGENNDTHGNPEDEYAQGFALVEVLRQLNVSLTNS